MERRTRATRANRARNALMAPVHTEPVAVPW